MDMTVLVLRLPWEGLKFYFLTDGMGIRKQYSRISEPSTAT
jgi:hypothetical protein